MADNARRTEPDWPTLHRTCERNMHLYRREISGAYRELEGMRAIIRGLKRGSCWCDVAQGGPNSTTHSGACLAASQLWLGEEG